MKSYNRPTTFVVFSSFCWMLLILKCVETAPLHKDSSSAEPLKESQEGAPLNIVTEQSQRYRRYNNLESYLNFNNPAPITEYKQKKTVRLSNGELLSWLLASQNRDQGETGGKIKMHRFGISKRSNAKINSFNEDIPRIFLN